MSFVALTAFGVAFGTTKCTLATHFQQIPNSTGRVPSSQTLQHCHEVPVVYEIFTGHIGMQNNLSLVVVHFEKPESRLTAIILCSSLKDMCCHCLDL